MKKEQTLEAGVCDICGDPAKVLNLGMVKVCIDCINSMSERVGMPRKEPKQTKPLAQGARVTELDGGMAYRQEEPLRVLCSTCGSDMLFYDENTRAICPQCRIVDSDNKCNICPLCKTAITWVTTLDNSERHCPSCGFNEYIVPASHTKIFASGAVRDDDNTPAYSLIPPCAIRRLANLYKEGEVHYPDRNWRKGIPVSNIIDHALEHLMKWLEGNRTDDHLAKVAWAMFSLMYYEHENKLEDDIKW